MREKERKIRGERERGQTEREKRGIIGIREKERTKLSREKE